MKMKSIVSLGFASVLLLGATACNNEPFELGSPLTPSTEVEVPGARVYLKSTLSPQTPRPSLAAFVAGDNILGTISEEMPITIALTEAMQNNVQVKLSLIPSSEVMEALEAIKGDKTGITGVAPDGLVKLETKTVTVEAGKYSAGTKLIFENKDKLKDITNGDYLVGVRLTEASAGVVAKDYAVQFFLVNRSTRVFMPVGEVDFSKLTKIDKAEFTPSPESSFDQGMFGIANAFDGIVGNNKQWLIRGREVFEITFNSDVALRGIRIAPILGDYSAYSLRTAKISFYGSDGQLLKESELGSLNSLIYKDGYYPFQLYAPITCRSIKIAPLSSQSYMGAEELEFYK